MLKFNDINLYVDFVFVCYFEHVKGLKCSISPLVALYLTCLKPNAAMTLQNLL